MKTYFKCSICGKFESVEDVEFMPEDEEKIKPLCRRCFERQQDSKAYEESAGEFSNYEDWMESRGATICDYDTPCREF